MSTLRRTKYFLLTCILLAGATQAAIYKTVDENGNVVFTDVPPKDAAQAVELKRGNDYAPTPAERPDRAVQDDMVGLLGEGDDEDGDDEAVSEGLLNPDDPNGDTAAPSAPAGVYTALTIVSPEADEALRNNEGNVTVRVQLTPSELDRVRNHTIRILLDGVPAGDASGGALTITNVDRGTHRLTAEVVDPEGLVKIASAPVVFHLQRYSALQGRRAN